LVGSRFRLGVKVLVEDVALPRDVAYLVGGALDLPQRQVVFFTA
jgi:hypothetical protein